MHGRGYFELINKDDKMVCIKLSFEGDALYESSKPSFMAVPPLESCYCEFDLFAKSLEVCSFILYI